MELFKVNILNTKDLLSLMGLIERFEPIITKRELCERAIDEFVEACNEDEDNCKKVYVHLREMLSSQLFDNNMQNYAERLQVELATDKFESAVKIVAKGLGVQRVQSNLVLKLSLTQYVINREYDLMGGADIANKVVAESEDMENCRLISRLVELVMRNKPEIKAALIECVERMEEKIK
ncbi:MAG: hypothetical protein IJB96_10170 [Lachnospira sp.]|nr:hypothetical protein [Lachnospira sp.]